MGSVIRLARASDAAALAGIYRPFVESTPISFETDPPDEQEMLRRVDETLPSYPWLVCETRARVVGYAYATEHRTRAAYQWSADVSMYVQSDYHRRGVARGLYTSFAGHLGCSGLFHRVCRCHAPQSSQRRPARVVGVQGGRRVTKTWDTSSACGMMWGGGTWRFGAMTLLPGLPLDLPDVQASSDWARLIARGESCLASEA